MPIYEYECPMCGNIEEVLEPMGSEPSEQYCSLDGHSMERTMSAGAFILKGDGWYKPSASGGE